MEFESANDHTADQGPYKFSYGTFLTDRYVDIQPQTKCAVYGNVMSMITPDGNYHTNKTITKDYALASLLYSKRTWEDDHYEYYTFQHDKYKLMLPATKLAPNCYKYMLAYSGITEAPALPATTLAKSCYTNMFDTCTSLTTAPELPAESLPSYCYSQMFFNCSKLNKVTCLAKEMTSYDAICQWLYGAGTDESVTERTFVHNKDNTSWVNNNSSAWSTSQWYVPTGWTIVDAE